MLATVIAETTGASVISAISTVGFPIVVCLILFWYVRELQKDHKEETVKFTDALNSNTLALQKLCDQLSLNREE